MINIVIPVYNTDVRQFQQAVYSVLAQTKKAFPIVVDDCSDEENSARYRDFCEKLNIPYHRLEENGGPAAARNWGLAHTFKACKYVAFLDSDDSLFPNFAEVVEEAAIKGNADVIYTDILAESATRADDHVISAEHSTTWTHGKLYRIDFLKENMIYFDTELRTNEDVLFNSCVGFLAKKKAYISKTFYIWRNYRDSLTRKQKLVDWTKENNIYYLLANLKVLDFIWSKIEDKAEMGVVVAQIYNGYQNEVALNERDCYLQPSFVEQIRQILSTKNGKRDYLKYCKNNFEGIPYRRGPYEWLKEIGVDVECIK